MEPVALNMQMTKMLIRRGGKEPPSHILDEILESLTDLDLTKPIGNERSFVAISVFVCKLSSTNGRRGREYILRDTGVDWQVHGLGRIDVTKGKFLIYFKPVAEPLHLPEYDIDCEMYWVEFVHNFSAVRAQIIIKKDGVVVDELHLMSLFAERHHIKPKVQVNLQVEAGPTSSMALPVEPVHAAEMPPDVKKELTS